MIFTAPGRNPLSPDMSDSDSTFILILSPLAAVLPTDTSGTPAREVPPFLLGSLPSALRRQVHQEKGRSLASATVATDNMKWTNQIS